jgi:NAD(P)-dependent dehydrogenase (short-subunit alcohol dehydrogenase family)
MVDLFTFAPDRKALVTGGASGIGLGVAKALADMGARVAIADLPAALARMDDGDKDEFMPVAMDVGDEASVKVGLASVATALDGLDTLVNSAGVSSSARSRGSRPRNGNR